MHALPRPANGTRGCHPIVAGESSGTPPFSSAPSGSGAAARGYSPGMVLAAFALQLVFGGGLGHARGDLPAWAQPGPPAPPVALLVAQGPSGADNPACRAEFCQPRVSIPGQEPRFDTRGKRTEMALAAIDRLQLGAISSLARAANTAGVRVDYVPPQLDAWSGGRGGGLGKLAVAVRWRLDAWHGPVWTGLAR